MINELLGRTDIDDFLLSLSRLGLIEVGIVAQYDYTTGKCGIDLYRVKQGRQLHLNDVELLWIGNAANGFQSEPVGSHCLVFFPRTPVPSLRNNQVKTRVADYDVNGAKAILLSTAQTTKLHVGFDGTGQFVIQSANFALAINEDGIVLRNASASSVYEFNNEQGFVKYEGGGTIVNDVQPDGSIEMRYVNSAGKVMYRMNYKPDGAYTLERNAHAALTPEQMDDPDTYTDYVWTEVWASDGTYTKTLKLAADDPTDPSTDKPVRIEEHRPDGTITRTLNSSSDVTKPLWVITENPDGAIELKQTADNGDVLNDVTITNAGDVTVAQTKAQNTVSLNQDGTCTINTKGAINVTSQDAITVSATNDCTVTGQHLVAGNGSKTLKDILITDLLGLLSAFDTVGSPASHNTGPNATTKINQFKQTWAQILG